MRWRRYRNVRSPPLTLLGKFEFVLKVNSIYGQRFGEPEEAMKFLRQEHQNGRPPYSGVHVDVYYNFWQWRARMR